MKPLTKQILDLSEASYHCDDPHDPHDPHEDVLMMAVAAPKTIIANDPCDEWPVQLLTKTLVGGQQT